MTVDRGVVRRGRAPAVPGGALAACLLAACLLAACSPGPGAAGVSGPGATCGSTHTAAGVPVVIKVASGSVDCRAAMQVEDEYAVMIRDGQVTGNGGGAPVTVHGWICQGYNTPQVLRTGNASRCHRGGDSILAVLPVPGPAGTAD